MRIVVLGDKSRYQFLRKLIPNASDQMDLSTETLGQQDILVVSGKASESAVSQRRKMQGRCFYCSKLPLHTELYFPGELNSEYENGASFGNYGRNTKIILFDEFPYRTKEEAELLESCQSQGNMEVLLVYNKRKALDSDLSSESESLQAVCELYREKKIPFELFDWEQGNDFLFWNRNLTTEGIEIKFGKMLGDMRDRIDRVFDSYYLMEYTLYLNAILTDPSVMEGLVRYQSSLQGRDVREIYCDSAYQFFWRQKIANLKKVIWGTVEMIYKNHEELCVWDMEKILEKAEMDLAGNFRAYIYMDKPLVCMVNKNDYRVFLYENSKWIAGFKSKVTEYFSTIMRDALKERIKEQIKIMEDLIK